jgi:hypothetical protein
VPKVILLVRKPNQVSHQVEQIIVRPCRLASKVNLHWVLGALQKVHPKKEIKRLAQPLQVSVLDFGALTQVVRQPVDTVFPKHFALALPFGVVKQGNPLSPIVARVVLGERHPTIRADNQVHDNTTIHATNEN